MAGDRPLFPLDGCMIVLILKIYLTLSGNHRFVYRLFADSIPANLPEISGIIQCLLNNSLFKHLALCLPKTVLYAFVFNTSRVIEQTLNNQKSSPIEWVALQDLRMCRRRIARRGGFGTAAKEKSLDIAPGRGGCRACTSEQLYKRFLLLLVCFLSRVHG